MRHLFAELRYTFQAILGGWSGLLLLAGFVLLAWFVSER
jgi:hypothetical protein